MIIYRTTNLLNGKSYIGLSVHNQQHYLGSGVGIKNAIKKYGKENFKKEILEDGFDSLDELCKAEIRWIALEKTSNPYGVYNMHEGGHVGVQNKGKNSEQIYGKDRAKEINSRISNTLKQKGIKPPSRLGCKGSDIQREAVRKTGKNRVITTEEINKLIARTVRPIVCLQNSTCYGSLKDAAEKLGLSRGNI